jgi:hypothetical protein
MKPARLKRVKQLLWLYFWLLIFEGALRRWILPGLSTPLLLVRDPIAILAVVMALPLLRQRPWRSKVYTLFLIAPLAFFLAITVGHGDFFTALYGGRILLFHLPLIFVFAAVLTKEDVIAFAWAVLWVSIPMTILIATQSNLPETHFLNIGTGGVGTAVFSGTAERFRPPGTFSFANGVGSFFTLASASLFAILYCIPIGQRERLFCVLVGIALVVALPVSISRSLLAGYLQVSAALVLSIFLSRGRVLPVLSGFVALFFAIWIATYIPAFQQTSDAFIKRWDTAAAVESRNNESQISSAWGVFEHRVLGGFIGPLSNLETIPLLGYGVGISTNVGSQRLSGGQEFLVGEGAWEASFGELGLPLGFVYVLWRLSLAVWVLRMALLASSRRNRLPLILLGSSFMLMLSGQTGQPTGLGFLVLAAGLTLAAFDAGSRANLAKVSESKP